MSDARPEPGHEERLRRAEEALRRTEREFHELIERLPDLISIRRAERIVYINPAGAALLGYARPSDLIGRNIFELVHPEDRARLERRIEHVDATGMSPLTMELRWKRPDGQVIVLELAPTQRVCFEGEPAFLVGARDVTERKRLQVQNALADRMVSLGILAAGVAHEINNPLSCVMGNLDYLAESLNDARVDELPGRLGEMNEAIRDAREAADRVRQIVLDLAAFSRTDAEASGPMDLRPVLESAINMAWGEIRTRARLIKEYGDVPLVEATEAQLGQVFLNLLVNAAQSIPPGAPEKNEVRVVTRTNPNGDLVVEFRDTGAGIPEDVRAHLFDPFFTTRGPGQGTGLGLAICHGIVSAHGGHIQVETEVGRGSVFRVVLPPGSGSDVTQTFE